MPAGWMRKPRSPTPNATRCTRCSSSRGNGPSLERYGGGLRRGRSRTRSTAARRASGASRRRRRTKTACSTSTSASRERFPRGRDDAAQARVTLRELLALTSGIGFGGLGSAVPTYDKCAGAAIKDEPGERFTYGGIPLQVFGAVLARKLASRGLTPHAYLRERLLDPIGMKIGSWRSLKDGTQPLPTGAFVTAREWLKFGRFVLDGGRWNGSRSSAKRRLPRASSVRPPTRATAWAGGCGPLETPPGIVHASGSGGQALYIDPVGTGGGRQVRSIRVVQTRRLPQAAADLTIRACPSRRNPRRWATHRPERNRPRCRVYRRQPRRRRSNCAFRRCRRRSRAPCRCRRWRG